MFLAIDRKNLPAHRAGFYHHSPGL
jgi:hypothetical protein